jgi:hypothetical protein
MRTFSNIFWLGTKELRSFTHDFVLLGLVAYAFSLAIIAQAQSSSQEVHNASIALSTRTIRSCRAASHTRSFRPISKHRDRSPNGRSYR